MEAFLAPQIFDGHEMRWGHALVVEGARVAAITPQSELGDILLHRFDHGVLCPGFVDLQVNGGGGVMLNGDPSLATLRGMAQAHAGLGATAILPTLITDTAGVTGAAIDAVESAIAAGVPGILGLHLEGPHIALARKGAHDARHVRPMGSDDLARLCDAAKRLPLLMVTVAPDVVTPEQIGVLSRAGVRVSLGHSDASFETCAAAVAAGAICATHLFNAMSPLASRAPGLVGAALAHGALSAGLIADGVHVHPEAIGIALRAKAGPGRLFLVSDAMALAGTEATRFALGGRDVLRRHGRLTLADGTLAGADLDLPTAVRNLVTWGVAAPEAALAMASRVPAEVAGLQDGTGTLCPGAPADFLLMDLDGTRGLRVWQRGCPVSRAG